MNAIYSNAEASEAARDRMAVIARGYYDDGYRSI